MENIIIVVGAIWAFCTICGKVTKMFISNVDNYEQHQCSECNVIQKYKVK